jgi:hypothetical protein
MAGPYTAFVYGDPAPSASSFLSSGVSRRLHWGLLLGSVSAPLPVGESLTGGIVGSAYSCPISIIGGTSPYTLSVTGSLPTGLTLSSSGVINGTPTAVGTYNFSITVTDAQSNQGSQAFSITVIAASSSSGGGNYGWIQ